ncbi:hypothetical protein NQ314_005788 [Rhamnusium bicolor]|uniref:Uncharacterized protein n=1 Tax=Rhamnusium bicolor TaxID=1586634 RepID=A0AAV8ZDH8_9CUCU|nr:hypothetical protein NQ314_005788 [Rhamnusium bicolor]
MVTIIALALNCYQCSGSDSNKPFQCNEWLTDDIDIQPEPCDNVYGAKYCIKHIGRFEGTKQGGHIWMKDLIYLLITIITNYLIT